MQKYGLFNINAEAARIQSANFMYVMLFNCV